MIPVTDAAHHYADKCACCGAALPQDRAKAYTAFRALDVELGDEGAFGWGIVYTWHTYYEAPCGCGHITRAEPYRAPADEADWSGVALTEWRLIGPSFAAI